MPEDLHPRTRQPALHLQKELLPRSKAEPAVAVIEIGGDAVPSGECLLYDQQPVAQRIRRPASGAARAAVVAFTLLPPAAFAACTQNDAAGSWRVYAGGFGSGSSWERCQFSINASGVVSASSNCIDSIRQSVAVTNGSVTLSNATRCLFVGTFKLGSTTNKIIEMTMAATKNIGGGVGISSPGADPFIFTFYKN